MELTVAVPIPRIGYMNQWLTRHDRDTAKHAKVEVVSEQQLGREERRHDGAAQVHCDDHIRLLHPGYHVLHAENGSLRSQRSLVRVGAVQ